jgi:hypothetical protein
MPAMCRCSQSTTCARPEPAAGPALTADLRSSLPAATHAHRQKRKLVCNPRYARLGVWPRVRLSCLGWEWGRGCGRVARARLWGLLDRMHTGGRICYLVYKGWRWSGLHLRPRLVPPARMAAIQHGSTATHPDAGGLAGTREDGDLHGWTRVDVLPPDGMQEVSGSSPLSSTQVRRRIRTQNP